jgi:hypothetical protein
MDFAASMKARREAVLRLFALVESFAAALERTAVKVGTGRTDTTAIRADVAV